MWALVEPPTLTASMNMVRIVFVGLALAEYISGHDQGCETISKRIHTCPIVGGRYTLRPDNVES